MTVRKDNSEYHEGYKAYRDAKPADANPYTDFQNRTHEDSRFNRWGLGWVDARRDNSDAGNGEILYQVLKLQPGMPLQSMGEIFYQPHLAYDHMVKCEKAHVNTGCGFYVVEMRRDHGNREI